MEGFDVAATLSGISATLHERQIELVERVTRERDEAAEGARTYALHLADGGDPQKHPDNDRGGRWGETMLVDFFMPLHLVYRAWNTARGGTHDVSPVRNQKKWRVAELLHSRLGEPVLFSELKAEYDRGSRFGTGADDIAKAVLKAQTDELIARKTKVGGKVAYVIRPKREGEEPAQNVSSFPTEKTTVAA